MKVILFIVMIAGMMLAGEVFAQPTVPVTFRYYPEETFARVHVPGTFNNWGNNSGGTIFATDGSIADSLDASTGFWMKTVILPFGTYYYKFYREKAAPTDVSARWISDPLNRNVNPADQNNSILGVDSLVLFELCVYPYLIETGTSGSKFVCMSGTPHLSGGLFQPAGSPLPSISASIDGVPIINPGIWFDRTTGLFTYTPPALADGIHTFSLEASSGTLTKKDSVRFEVRARPVQIQTPVFTTHKQTYITAGIVMKPDGSGPDSTRPSIEISVNGNVHTAAVINGSFIDSTELAEGENKIKAITELGTDSVTVTRIVNHAPHAAVTARLSGNSVILDAAATTDPDGQTVTNFRWTDDTASPLGLNGKTGATATIPKPAAAGEHYFGLIVTDPDGNADTTRSYFIVDHDTVANPSIAANPSWAKQGRIYFLFPKAASTAGTLSAAAGRLPIIKNMGFNIIWMMPVMVNAYPINNDGGPGYNITDFYNVAPEYGSNQDFKDFVSQAHALGLKVILDVTPNHSSRFHPWSADAHANKQKSPYWNWYQHTIPPSGTPAYNSNGLGWNTDSDGFVYYNGFSEQLLNLNWTDIDMQSEMIGIYKYWIKEFGVDGYRFDVYWGPHRRYGEQYMGKPVRDALKHIKPDIFLLAEDDGTGAGTETIYADYSSGGINGGVDASYDFKLFFNQVRGFQFTANAIDALNTEILNAGYYPGPNSLFMRFMESQDEDRIAYAYSSGGTLDTMTALERTMPMASTIFTIPGIPMIWNGQEVGKGYGDPNFDSRRRGVIDWNFTGKNLLEPHYQRLAQIRSQFKAFSTQRMNRIVSANALVYAYTRPYTREDGIVAVNFGPSAVTDTVSFSVSDLSGWVSSGKTYIASDLYTDTQYPVEFTAGGGSKLVLTLPAYGTAILVLSDSAKHVTIPQLDDIGTDRTLPEPPRFTLFQNFPNPFNPSTSIRFNIPRAGQVKLRVYNILGEETAVIADGFFSPGIHEIRWDGRTAAGAAACSGVYFVRLEAGSRIESRKIVLVK